MEPKKLYSLSWTQPWTLHQVEMIEIDALKEMVIEQMLDDKDFTEADELIARLKSK